VAAGAARVSHADTYRFRTGETGYDRQVSQLGLLQIDVRGFRNLAPLRLSLHRRWTGITGPNAAGKTNLLEAVYYLCRQRGFLERNLAALRTWDQPEGMLEAALQRSDRESVECRTLRWQQNRVRRFVDGDAVARARTWVCAVPIFGYRPDDDLFFHLEPARRRHYLDWLCSYRQPAYIDVLAAFEHALRQRNRLLKRGGAIHAAEWDAWEHELARQAVRVARIRHEVAAAVRTRFRALWTSLELGAGDLIYHGFREDEQDYRRQLAQQRERDRAIGWTRTGPHRDDLQVLWLGRSIRESGSQGIRKFAVIVLAAACALEAPTVYRRRLFYLDDIEGELDAENEQKLYRFLAAHPLQILFTGVRRIAALTTVVPPAELQWYTIADGVVSEAEDDE